MPAKKSKEPLVTYVDVTTFNRCLKTLHERIDHLANRVTDNNLKKPPEAPFKPGDIVVHIDDRQKNKAIVVSCTDDQLRLRRLDDDQHLWFAHPKFFRLSTAADNAEIDMIPAPKFGFGTRIFFNSHEGYVIEHPRWLSGAKAWVYDVNVFVEGKDHPPYVKRSVHESSLKSLKLK